jgi:hypothetical protein
MEAGVLAQGLGNMVASGVLGILAAAGGVLVGRSL